MLKYPKNWRKCALYLQVKPSGDERHPTGIEAVNSSRNVQFASLDSLAQDRACRLQPCHIEDDVLLDSIVEQISGLIRRSFHCGPYPIDERGNVT